MADSVRACRALLKERFVLVGAFDKDVFRPAGAGCVPAEGAGQFNMGMNDSLWGRLSSGDQREVDQLVTAGRHIQAIALMRERAGLPRPDLRDCVDLLEQRASVLRG